MKISDAGLAHLKQWEKFMPVAYMPTPNDVWTIGVGSLMKSS